MKMLSLACACNENWLKSIPNYATIPIFTMSVPHSLPDAEILPEIRIRHERSLLVVKMKNRTTSPNYYYVSTYTAIGYDDQ